jgi:4-methylaminobutanoate oxidase (formaldehyde-forming)
LGPDETPWQAGLLAGVKLDKAVRFIGRQALLEARGEPLAKKLVSIVFDDPADHAWGGEALLLGGAPVGELSSAGWGYRAGRCIGLGYLRGAAAQAVHAGTPVAVDLWGEARPARAFDLRL